MPPPDKLSAVPRSPEDLKLKLSSALEKMSEEKLASIFEVFLSESINSFKLESGDLSERLDRKNFMPGRKENFINFFSDKVSTFSESEPNTVNAIINALRLLNNPYVDTDQYGTNQTIQNIIFLFRKLLDSVISNDTKGSGE